MKEIDSFEEQNRLEVKMGVAATFKAMNNPFITGEKMKDKLSMVMPDAVQLVPIFNVINEWEDNGGKKSFLCNMKGYRNLIDKIRLALCQRINESNDLTRMSCMNYEDEMWDAFDDINPKMLIKIFQESNGKMLHIWGVPGSGKTSAALKISELLLDDEYIIITNVKVDLAMLFDCGIEIKPHNKSGEIEPIKNIYRSQRFSDIMLLCLILKLKGKNIVLVWDEVSLGYNRQEAYRKGNIDYGKFIRLIRKFGLNIIFIEQIEGGLASIAEQMIAAKIHKISPQEMQYTTRFFRKNYNKFINNVPDTKLKFDTLDPAGMDYDIDLGEMFRQVAVEIDDKFERIEIFLRQIVQRNYNKKYGIIEYKSNEIEMTSEDCLNDSEIHKVIPKKKLITKHILTREDAEKVIERIREKINGGMSGTEAAESEGWSRQKAEYWFKKFEADN